MKFLEKVKNMFTEEVEEELKVSNEVKIEQIIPKENKEIKAIEEFNQIKETEIKKEEKKPVFFTDDDFNDLDNYFKREELPKREEKKEQIERSAPKLYATDENPSKIANEYVERYNDFNKEKEPYQGNFEEKKAPKFKPTPIISPVYGILDKNYHKEDIVSKQDAPQKSIDGLSVDSIRKKAYGTLEDELENTLFGSNSILFNDSKKTKENDFFAELEDETNLETDTDLRDLENITMDIGKELDTLLNKKKIEKTKENVEIDDALDKIDFDKDDDLFNLIDTMYDGDADYDD